MYNLFFLAVFMSMSTVSLQAQSSVDPGISVHNYKHPNKAHKAKTDTNETSKIIEVTDKKSLSEIAKYAAPKYAVQPANLVITKRSKSEGNAINPLTSYRHYKTQKSAVKKQTDH